MQFEHQFVNVFSESNGQASNTNASRSSNQPHMINMKQDMSVSMNIEINLNTTMPSDKKSSKFETLRSIKKKRIPRNKGGCLCCRKRKIKCDEAKPVCVKCERGGFLCCWPKNGNASLSHHSDFKLVKIDNDTKFINMNPKIEQQVNNLNFSNNDDISLASRKRDTHVNNYGNVISGKYYNNYCFNNISNLNIDYNLDNGSLSYDYNFVNDFTNETDHSYENDSIIDYEKIEEVIDEDAIIRRYIRETTKNLMPINNLTNLNSQELKCFDAFINGFIVSISNQLAHEKLLPGSIIVPIGFFDPLIMKLCLTCGASYLSQCKYKNEYKKTGFIGKEISRIQSDVKSLDVLILKELISRLDSRSIMESRKWILVYLTLRNARQKFLYEGKTAQTINLISGIQAIKLWIETKRANLDVDNDFQYINCPDDGYIFSLGNEHGEEMESYILLDKLVDKTKLLKFNNDLELTSSSVQSPVTAFERTLLENFLFNYACTLLIIDKALLHCMPSPFEVFQMINPLLSEPIFNCAVPWMNNPTAGAALSMVELQAKVIWLSLSPVRSENDISLIKDIQRTAKFYTRPIIDNETWSQYPKNVSKKLLESCYISEIVAKGVYLYSIKVLNMNLDENAEEVQEIVDSMFKILSLISNHSQTSVIAKWSFLVLGSAILDASKQKLFKTRLAGFIDTLQTGSLKSGLAFLEKVWANKVGLNALFIEEYLDLLVI